MDINTQNSSGMMNGMPRAPRADKKVGPIVGVLIIVLILIIAGLYFFGQKLNTDYTTTPAGQTSMNTPYMGNNGMVADVAQADDVNSLQADLNAQMMNVDYSF